MSVPAKEYDIESMSHGAHAIAHDDGQVIFIENACPGDKVKAKVYDYRKDFSFAALEEVLSESELRAKDAKCKIHKICGSCQWQHIDYQEQLKQKKKNLEDLIRKTQIEFDGEIPDLLGMEEPWNYRNKVTYPIKTVESTGRLQAGYFKRNSNELINVKYCPIQYSIFDEIIEKIKDECSERSITKRILRHIMVRSNHDQSEILVSLIIRKDGFGSHMQKQVNELFDKLHKEFPQIVTTSINFNDNSTNVIMGNETELYFGKGYIVETLNDVEYEISTQSFFQVNTKQFKKILDLILQRVDKGGKLLDAYCGAGTISLNLKKSQPGLEIIGIELVKAAIDNALANAKRNNLEVDFKVGKVEDHITEYKNGDFDYVVVNPPRKGCNKSVISALGEIKAKEIIYVSCNPATITRDIKMLEDFGYKLDFIQGIDMFPHSFHFETLAFLTLK